MAKLGSVTALLTLGVTLSARTGSPPKSPHAERKCLLEALRFVALVVADGSSASYAADLVVDRDGWPDPNNNTGFARRIGLRIARSPERQLDDFRPLLPYVPRLRA